MPKYVKTTTATNMFIVAILTIIVIMAILHTNVNIDIKNIKKDIQYLYVAEECIFVEKDELCYLNICDNKDVWVCDDFPFKDTERLTREDFILIDNSG